jgi:uncharacterized protein YjbJ (UPF0337 family)
MQDVLVGSWNQLRQPIKEWWNKLTDADLDCIDGKYDALVSMLSIKYGYTIPHAQTLINQRLAEFEKGHRALLGQSS